MKINPINLSFNGISKPYTNANGYRVVPIAKDPTQGEINAAIRASKFKKPHCGLNGRAYFYGEDLVVKKYMPEKEAVNFGPDREIKALDKMYDRNIIYPNIQQGLFAFSAPNSDTYLVSTKVRGKDPDVKTNPFNRENLQTLVDVLYELDVPRRLDGSEKHFPYDVPMHFDMSPSNVVIDKNGGGILDFEYLDFVDLDEEIYSQLVGIKKTYCDFSDIAGIPSNLRNFEQRTFHLYLISMQSEEAQELFKDYLDIKSGYHLKRFNFFSSEKEKANMSGNYILSALCDKLLQKELAHHIALSNLDDDIVKAEAIKIQLSAFLYKQSPFYGLEDPCVNINQIKDYVEKAKEFFDEQYSNSKGFKKDYFEDCCQLMSNWYGLIHWMNWQKELLDSVPEFKSKAEEEAFEKERPGLIKDAKIFGSKLTTNHVRTLDERINHPL